jgi:hypothetical protein
MVQASVNAVEIEKAVAYGPKRECRHEPRDQPDKGGHVSGETPAIAKLRLVRPQRPTEYETAEHLQDCNHPKDCGKQRP